MKGPDTFEVSLGMAKLLVEFIFDQGWIPIDGTYDGIHDLNKELQLWLKRQGWEYSAKERKCVISERISDSIIGRPIGAISAEADLDDNVGEVED